MVHSPMPSLLLIPPPGQGRPVHDMATGEDDGVGHDGEVDGALVQVRDVLVEDEVCGEIGHLLHEAPLPGDHQWLRWRWWLMANTATTAAILGSWGHEISVGDDRGEEGA